MARWRVNEEGQEREEDRTRMNADERGEEPEGANREETFGAGSPTQTGQVLPSTMNRREQEARGRRSHTQNSQRGGHYVRAARPRPNVPIRDIAIDATLRAVALRMATHSPIEDGCVDPSSRKGSQGSFGDEKFPDPFPEDSYSFYGDRLLASAERLVTTADLRTKVRRSRTGNLILFVVDSSGSMGARKRMVAVKGAILSLLLDAYQKRDRVGLIAFRGQGAQLLVPPTNSVELAERQLRQIPTGGRTPLFAGLQLAHELLTNHLRKDSALTPLLVLVTDGRANSGPSPLEIVSTSTDNAIPTLVLDSEQGFVKMGKARQLAEALDALYMPLDALNASTIGRSVRMLLR